MPWRSTHFGQPDSAVWHIGGRILSRRRAIWLLCHPASAYWSLVGANLVRILTSGWTEVVESVQDEEDSEGISFTLLD